MYSMIMMNYGGAILNDAPYPARTGVSDNNTFFTLAQTRDFIVADDIAKAIENLPCHRNGAGPCNPGSRSSPEIEGTPLQCQ
jgi:hypothetical protein